MDLLQTSDCVVQLVVQMHNTTHRRKWNLCYKQLLLFACTLPSSDSHTTAKCYRSITSLMPMPITATLEHVGSWCVKAEKWHRRLFS